MNEITDINERLSISGIRAISENPTDRFDHVVSVCQDTRDANVGCQYTHVPLAEDVLAEINWGGSSDYVTFCEAADVIYETLEDGQRLLVHCHHGQNRSVSTAVAAWARYRDCSVGVALDDVRAERTIANPSDTMLEYAVRYVQSYS